MAAYAAEHADEPWVRGSGWTMDDFLGGVPRRDALDRVVPDRPVYLQSRDGHSAWVNSRALELAGVAAHTPDPVDGRIDRDSDGNPVGGLQEGAMDLVARLIPETTPDELVAALRLGQAELHSLGVTNWQDAIVTPEVEEIAYAQLAGRGELSGRVVGALWWERARGDEQIDELIERRARTAIGNYRPTEREDHAGRCAGELTGAVLEPHLGPDDQPTPNRGLSQVDPEALTRYVARLDALGFRPGRPSP